MVEPLVLRVRRLRTDCPVRCQLVGKPMPPGVLAVRKNNDAVTPMGDKSDEVATWSDGDATVCLYCGELGHDVIADQHGTELSGIRLIWRRWA